MNRQLMLKGTEAYEEIGKAVKRSPKTIRRWMKEGVPSAHDAYTVALACGCSEQESIAIANELLHEAKESA